MFISYVIRFVWYIRRLHGGGLGYAYLARYEIRSSERLGDAAALVIPPTVSRLCTLLLRSLILIT